MPYCAKATGMTYSAGRRLLFLIYSVVDHGLERIEVASWDAVTLTQIYRRSVSPPRTCFLREPSVYPIDLPPYTPAIFYRLHRDRASSPECQLRLCSANRDQVESAMKFVDQVSTIWGCKIVSLRSDGILVRWESKPQEGESEEIIGKIEGEIPALFTIK